MSSEERQKLISKCRRVVIKLGTRVLTQDNGTLAVDRVEALISATAEAHQRGQQVLIVSSGAVGLGRDALHVGTGPIDLSTRQACAAVGQTRLMSIYADRLAERGLQAGQVLLTRGDFDDRKRYLNLRTTLLTMLRLGVIPIINENDAVATEELAYTPGTEVFGDNDGLSALVASKLGADLLILLTDVPGVYDKDPQQHPDARLQTELSARDKDQTIEAHAPTDGLSRGGMKSKIEAARVAAQSGCHAVITSGRDMRNLSLVLEGQPVGTLVRATAGLSAKRRWIAWGTPSRGEIHVDEGAVKALTTRGASLLAAGVQRIVGPFNAGDVIAICNSAGEIFARGVITCDDDATERWAAGEAPPAARNHHALVHRDHLVLLTTESS